MTNKKWELPWKKFKKFKTLAFLVNPKFQNYVQI